MAKPQPKLNTLFSAGWLTHQEDERDYERGDQGDWGLGRRVRAVRVAFRDVGQGWDTRVCASPGRTPAPWFALGRTKHY